MNFFAPQETNFEYLDKTELDDLYNDLAVIESLLYDDPQNTNLQTNKANLETAINHTLSLHAQYVPTKPGKSSDIKQAMREGKVASAHNSVRDVPGIINACKSILHDMDTVMDLEQRSDDLSQDEWEQLHVGAGPFLKRVLKRTPFQEIKK